MSLSHALLLRNLALGQAMLVAPALGDSYEGKSAGTISAMLLMIAADLEREEKEAAAFETRLLALLSSARPSDEALAADLASLSASLDGRQGPRPVERLLAALVRLHAHADDHDPRLAADCRAFLADWAASRRIDPPAPPNALPPA